MSSSDNPEDAPPVPSVLTPDLPSSTPAINVHREPRSDTGSVNIPPTLSIGDLLALTAIFVGITLRLLCPDKVDGHPRVCRVLGVLAPIFLNVHIGAALATFGMFIIPLTGGDVISFRRLRLLWAVLFALGLFCTVVQISLYAWVIGNSVTAIITFISTILCFLPGFIIVFLKWYPSPMERRGIEA